MDGNMDKLSGLVKISTIALAALGLVSCASNINPTSSQYDTPKWTFENPNAERSAPTPVVKSDAAMAEGSLEALRSGQSSATPASSPLKEIYYGFDSSELSAESRKILSSNADWLKTNPAARVQIEGHCDQRGTVEYNLALGSRRAQAALDYLVTLGIAKDRLTTISYGQEIPVCAEKNEGCWAKNRRARFVITAAKSTS